MKAYSSVTLVNFQLVKWYRKVSTIFVFLVIFTCILSGIAWSLGFMRNQHASLLLMPHTAIILALTALTILILNFNLPKRNFKRLAYLLVATNTGIGFFLIRDYFGPGNVSLNPWLYLGMDAASLTRSFGKLVPQTTLALTLINLALVVRLVPGLNKLKYPPSQILAFCAMLLAIYGLTGILFKADHFFHLSHDSFTNDTWMVTGTLLLLCSLALILSDTRRGMMNIIVSQTIAGKIARIHLLAILAVPPLLGLLFRGLEYLGWYQATAEAAIFALLMMSILMVLTWSITRHLNAVELNRHKAEIALHVKMKQVQLLSSVAEAANASADINKTLSYCLEQICQHLKWSVGHVFLIDQIDKTLAPSGIWYFDSDATREKMQAFRYVTDHKGVDNHSLTADIVASGLPIFLENLTATRKYRRGEAASEAGLVTALMVPIYAGDELSGVMEFYATESRDLDLDVMPILESLGKQIGRVFERRKMDSLKDKMIEIREDVLASVSHDLKNPLAVISSAVDILDKSTASQQGMPSHLDSRMIALIKKSVEKMSRMIGDLLDMAKLESGTLRIMTQDEIPCEIIEEAYESFALLAKNKSITLEKHCQSYLPKLRCDRGRLLQALSNLINNALKFTPSSGQIDLSVYQAGSSICFVVEDTGPGISSSDIPKLFNRYWQSERTRSLGTGLGLAIAKAIVDTHHGKIQAENRTDTHGSRFLIIIPLA